MRFSYTCILATASGVLVAKGAWGGGGQRGAPSTHGGGSLIAQPEHILAKRGEIDVTDWFDFIRERWIIVKAPEPPGPWRVSVSPMFSINVVLKCFGAVQKIRTRYTRPI